MDTNLLALEKSLPVGSLEAYTYWVNQIPLLSKDEERALAEKFRTEGDLDAARKLVLAHLRFVVHVAKNYHGYGLQQADLVQEGNIGLMKAVKRFDPDLGVRLVSFAIHWIKAEIHEFVLRNWRIVRMATTKAQRKLFFNLRKAANKLGQLGWLTGDEVNMVAKELKVKPKEVLSMEMRLHNHDTAFDGFVDDDEGSDGAWHAPVNYLEDANANPEFNLEQSDWEIMQGKNLNHALTRLDQRSRDIIEKRWLRAKKATLQDLANEYKVSAERVRQLEFSAMNRLKKELKDLC